MTNEQFIKGLGISSNLPGGNLIVFGSFNDGITQLRQLYEKDRPIPASMVVINLNNYGVDLYNTVVFYPFGKLGKSINSLGTYKCDTRKKLKNLKKYIKANDKML